MDALLAPRGIEAMRVALAEFSVDAVAAVLGIEGEALLARGDMTGVRRILPRDNRTATLVRLFLLGDPVDEPQARAALAPLDLAEAEGAGLLACSAQAVRALVDIRPYAERQPLQRLGTAPSGAADPQWWVVSDFGSDVRTGPVAGDHVLGVGAAALTLAQATVRDPVGRAADIGTGCGVQSLHLRRHCGQVTATDTSARALRFAATTAALSGVHWDLRQGSLVDPLAGERYDLIVANPPFVVSPGLTRHDGGHDYRDSGMSGDALCRQLVAGLPGVLARGGRAQLLANWMITRSTEWTERLHDWLAPTGCDAWVWQREVADPAEYVSLWLADAGHRPGTASYAQAYDEWLDWFVDHDVVAVGMGMITMWQSDTAGNIVCQDVPQPLGQPVGRFVQPWHRRMRWLRESPDSTLLDSRLAAVEELVIETAQVRTESGWEPAPARLRQSHGLRWDVETDDAFIAVVRGCDGVTPLGQVLAVLAASLDAPLADVQAAALPVVRDLIGRGFLEPVLTQ